ncbi:hypothetical protein CL630_01955 [bacterium]|nr:hypothetical protein [bacterium]|tara:strand:+ start:7258 stop:7980 length:723 start_codon:yes stop_codon:yes gene_type:complete
MIVKKETRRMKRGVFFNKNCKLKSLKMNELKNSINQTIEDLSEKHRMHRKIRFLLDVRGLLVTNKIKGAYAEFGIFRGEMMYAASKILGNNIEHYYGFDTFEGLPKPKGNDEKKFVFEKLGFMKSTYDEVKALLGDVSSTLIKGDFRKEETKKEIISVLKPISILSVDCNWPSSVEAALNISAKYLQDGSIVYFDDYFTGTSDGDYMLPILEKLKVEHGIKCVYFQTYPPFARAFIVFRN